jgi:hypothetical protein
MAGAFVAVADDSSAVYWNPAGLAWPTGSTFDAQFGATARGRFVGFALPSLGLSYYQLPTVWVPEIRQNDGSGKVQIRPSTTSNVGATINQTIVNGLVIGTTARLVRAAFGGPGRTTVDFDLGTIYSAGDFRAGVTVRNLREPKFETDGATVRLSRQVRLGVAYVPRSLPTGVHGPLTVAFDTDLVETKGAATDLRDAAAGGEYWFGHGLMAARAGIRWTKVIHGDVNAAVASGFTVRLPHSVFVEGHISSRPEGEFSERWGVGARVTF